MFKFFVFALVFSASVVSHAQFVCGGLDTTRATKDEIEEFLNSYGMSAPISPKAVSCGLESEGLRFCRGCKPVSEDQMNVLRPLMADRQHRRWHSQWHSGEMGRGGLLPIMSDKASIDRMQKAGLLPKGDIQAMTQIRSNSINWGENFLFMHREMIKMTQIQLTFNGRDCIEPATVQDVRRGGRGWPIPLEGAPLSPEAEEELDGLVAQIRRSGSELENPRVLRGLTLDQLGRRLRNEVHGQLHALYQDTPSEVARKCPRGNLNSPTCDDLLWPQSSHVNPNFWRIHGLIDRYIGLWLKANNYNSISKDCSKEGQTPCYQWKGTWAGHPPNF